MAAHQSPRGFGRHLYRAPIWLYGRGLGGLLGRRFLLLTHIGRKTGLQWQTVLEVMRHDAARDAYVVAAGFGARSDWYRNILVSPGVVIQVGTRHLRARARALDPEEAFQELSAYVRRHPIAARFVARLLGSPLDGTEQAVRALAARIPVVELTCRATD